MARNAVVSIILRARDLASPVFRGAEGGVKRLKGAIFSLQGAFASLGATVTASVVVGFLVKVNREYGKLLTQLQTFEGTRERALGVFRDLSKFAAETPFSIGELTEAYITLRSAGITPTLETLRLFGDQAAAFGGRINDFAEAVRAATTGEMERLKQFGVVARLQGDKIFATFNGQTKVIGRSAGDLTRYLEELSRVNFAGGMERQAKTLDGALSNLQDAAETLARTIGDAGLTQDLVNLTRGLTDFLNAGNGLETLRLYFLSIRTVVLTIYDALQLVVHAGFTPILVLASTAAGIIQSLTGIMVGALMVPAAMIDAVTNNRFQLAKKMQAVAGGRFSTAGRSFTNVGRHITSLGENIGETMANASLRGKEIDRAAAAAMLAEGKTPPPGGLKANGAATAPTNVFNPKAEKDAEAARKKVITDLQDQADLLGEQIELRIAGKNALKESLELEMKLTKLMGAKGTTAGEQLSLLRTVNNLRESRRDAGLLTRGEQARRDLFKNAVIAPGVPNLVNKPGEQPLGRRVGESLKEAIGEAVTLDKILTQMTTDTLQGFGSAVETAFAAMADGSMHAGRAFASAMLGAIGEVASGLGQLALGKAGLAIGDALTGDPRGLAAAAKYSLAATTLFALAGLMKGKASQISGGGARSGRADSQRATRDLSGSKGEATLVIEGGLLDMSDPRQERAFKKAIESFSGRKVRVKKSA